MKRLKTIIKELNDLLPEVEKLLVRIISLVGWILILIKIITSK